MKNRKYQYSRAVCCLAAAMLSLASLDAQETLAKPENYDEIVALVKASSLNHPPYTQEEGNARMAARKLLRAKGDEAIPALLFHFSERIVNGDCVDLVSTISEIPVSTETMKTMADFFIKLMNPEPKGYVESQWIGFALKKIIVKGDPEEAKRIAWTFLDKWPFEDMFKDITSEEKDMSNMMRGGAYSVLHQVGTTEDLERLGLTEEQVKNIVKARVSSPTSAATSPPTSDTSETQAALTPQEPEQAQHSSAATVAEPTEFSGLVWLITLAVAFLAGIGYVFYRRK